MATVLRRVRDVESGTEPKSNFHWTVSRTFHGQSQSKCLEWKWRAFSEGCPPQEMFIQRAMCSFLVRESGQMLPAVWSILGGSSLKASVKTKARSSSKDSPRPEQELSTWQTTKRTGHRGKTRHWKWDSKLFLVPLPFPTRKPKCLHWREETKEPTMGKRWAEPKGPPTCTAVTA